jgi:hypothetical protein
MTQQDNIQNDIIIRVFSGISVEYKCGTQLHPVNEVKRAVDLVNENKSVDVYSNSPDFVSAMKYYCKMKKISVVFFIDGENCGDDIEPVFISFNKSLHLINKFVPDSEY